ncbi:DEAD/DEAH box helicase [Steroidobacter sp.]|uniref:DEAD/DEAH box helicase n=1 Tax=Steroidobacter sp. TaxID=1978227 RepID=UPI001A425D59|nr:DEAD/DEAH box helicase [Steroidobacter sp.]MBL8264997.1 SWIM zinc finger family protein [Steroidobacter sp.]
MSESPSLRRLQVTLGDDLFLAAQQLARDGAVSELRIVQSGSVVTGQVAEANARHRVYLRHQSATDRQIAEAECSCGRPSPCVHIAAVEIAAVTNAPSVATPRPAASLQRATSASTGPQLQQRLYYLLQATAAGELQLATWVGQAPPGSNRLARGGTSIFVPRGNEFPRYVDSADRQILQQLLTQRTDGPWILRDTAGTTVLNDAIATGRARWQTLDGTSLKLGKARPARISWQLLENGEQYLQCEVSEDKRVATFFDLDVAMYVDPGSNEIGAVTLPCDIELFRRFFNAPPVTPEQVPTVTEEIESTGAPLPKPRALVAQAQKLRKLTAQLYLAEDPIATLYFVYNGLPVYSRSLRGGDRKVRIFKDNRLYEIPRDLVTERQLQQRLDAALANSPQGREFWLGFAHNTIAELRAEGWDVVVADDFPYRLVESSDWYVDADTGRDKEWFDLKLGIVIDGVQVNLLPALVDYLQGALGTGEAGVHRIGEQLFVQIPDGRYLPVPIDRIKRIADTLVELFDHDALTKQQTLSLPVTQASRLAQLTADPEAPKLRSPDTAFLQSVEELRNFTAIEPLQPPEQFKATLRPYQQEGLGWLQFLRRCRLGGILADDMGLGKTVQTLAHLALEKEAGRLTKPSLIVAPVSVIGNWQREIQQFAPHLKQLTLHGSRRKELFPQIAKADVVITAYPLLQLDSEVLTSHEFYLVVMDEAQVIKNPRAKVSQAARALQSEHRLCLTGTPMENHLGELWSLVDFLQPALLGDEREFQRQYRTAIEKNNDRERALALSRRIAPFMLRRTKDAVAPELPEKTQIIETIALDEKQRDFYDGVRLASHRRVRETIEERGLARSQITVLDALLKLRQACCDPRLVASAEPTDETVPSAKMDWLSNALPEMIEEGRRILLFSQFTSMLALIEEQVQELGIPYLLLTGETRERTPLIEKFQGGTVPLFLISLKAGGTGLNLTAADTVIHYDPWWNPAVEAQATDRAHRIGQHKPVFVYKLIAQGTVEERIVRLQEQKHALANQLYTEKNAAPLQLDAADLEMLFAP